MRTRKKKKVKNNFKLKIRFIKADFFILAKFYINFSCLTAVISVNILSEETKNEKIFN